MTEEGNSSARRKQVPTTVPSPSGNLSARDFSTLGLAAVRAGDRGAFVRDAASFLLLRAPPLPPGPASAPHAAPLGRMGNKPNLPLRVPLPKPGVATPLPERRLRGNPERPASGLTGYFRDKGPKLHFRTPRCCYQTNEQSHRLFPCGCPSPCPLTLG